MWKLSRAGLFLPALMFTLSLSASAQTRDVSKFMSAQAPVDARAVLASFPDSQAVLFVNSRRIVNEALPRVLPAADYQKMIEQASAAGFDLRAAEYTAVGVRFAEGSPSGTTPEVIIVVKGGFNADTLLALGRVALSTQNVTARQETYGSKTIQILDAATLGKLAGVGAAKSPVPLTEVGIAALAPDTLAVGVPAYIKAAIDASSGRGGLKSSTVELATRDPQTLVSLTADIPPSLSDMVHKFGAPGNQELDQMLSWIKQVSISGGMNAADFTLGTMLLTDAPEHASAFSGLARMGLLALQTKLGQDAARAGNKDADKARAALNVLQTVVNRTDGNTLVITASVPQATVAEMVKEQAAKPPAQQQQQTPRRSATRRRARRRH